MKPALFHTNHLTRGPWPCKKGLISFTANGLPTFNLENLFEDFAENLIFPVKLFILCSTRVLLSLVGVMDVTETAIRLKTTQILFKNMLKLSPEQNKTKTKQ
jgi:hypothetical protein